MLKTQVKFCGWEAGIRTPITWSREPLTLLPPLLFERFRAVSLVAISAGFCPFRYVLAQRVSLSLTLLKGCDVLQSGWRASVLLNESVDLPEVDTILFLRPTESALLYARWPASPAAMSRASFFACYGGTRETDEQRETSKRSLRPPFMNRLYPAETRLKEGAIAHDFGPNRWECSLAAVSGALSARSPQYQGTAALVSNGAVDARNEPVSETERRPVSYRDVE